ncbi:unnamed protein product [Urochloa decumbens]|uniref:Peroxidase n=1 Tax=Urochloa decumbens TaxID=240449 RepID=A0ABC9CMR6_9POAL
MASPNNAVHYSFLLLALLLCCSTAYGQLSKNYYDNACPSLDLTGIVDSVLASELRADPRMGASLLRLFFHDCFPQGCDASVLLVNDTARGIDSEQNAGPNKDSLRGFAVIDKIKEAVEYNCSHTVSCADILAVTAREAVIFLGGPSWTVRLGRRDSLNAFKDKANTDLPDPTFTLQQLEKAFRNKNFSPSEMVALSGGHSIGSVRCRFAADPVRKLQCQNMALVDPSHMEPLDTTSLAFDNRYYGDVVNGTGVLGSDRVLMDKGERDKQVRGYSSNRDGFFNDFSNAMVRMSEMNVLTGTQGQIRIDCKRLN